MVINYNPLFPLIARVIDTDRPSSSNLLSWNGLHVYCGINIANQQTKKYPQNDIITPELGTCVLANVCRPMKSPNVYHT